MRACPYCGYVFGSRFWLRSHISGSQAHKAQQLTVKATRRGRRRMAVAQNEAHDAGSQGSPMDEDSSRSGNDGGNYGELAEPVPKSRSTVTAQNDANGTGRKTHSMSQSPLQCIDNNIDRSHTAMRGLPSVSLAAVHNGADDAARQVSPMDHISPLGQVAPRPNHQSSNEESTMGQCSSRSNSLFDDNGDITETFPLSHSSTTTQDDTRDGVNQTSPMHHISPISEVPPETDHQSSNRGSSIGQDSSSSNYGSDDHSHLVVAPSSSCSSAASQQNVCDAGCQTPPMVPPPQEDHFNGIPRYAAEALRNTIKISLSTLCSDFMATAYSDLPRARRDLDDLKEIANQYFSTTESSFDLIHDRAES